MGSDWIDSLLTESLQILKRDLSSGSAQPTSPEKMENRCTQLLKAFAISADPRFFEGFYSLTSPLFNWFTQKQLADCSKIDSNHLTQRIYGVLCEYALCPTCDVPSENLFSWCFCLINNLIDFQKKQDRSEDGGDAPIASDNYSLYPSSTEAWMRSKHLEEPERVFEHLAETWITDDANLSTIEKEVLIYYYRENLDLQILADRIGLSRDRAERLLSISRLKMLRILEEKEAGDLALEQEKQS